MNTKADKNHLVDANKMDLQEANRVMLKALRNILAEANNEDLPPYERLGYITKCAELAIEKVTQEQ